MNNATPQQPTTSRKEIDVKTKTFSIGSFAYFRTDSIKPRCHIAEARIFDKGITSRQPVGYIEADKYSNSLFAHDELFAFIHTDEAERYLGVYNTLDEAKAALETLVESLVIWENAERRTHLHRNRA